MNDRLLVLFMGFILGLIINNSLALPDQRESTISLVDYSLYNATSSISALHQIKIEEVPRLESYLETVLAQDIIGISHELENDSLSEKDRKRVVQMLVLVSVMNEKFEIKSWRTNADLQNVLEKAQELEPKETQTFRSKDWNQPMWADRDCA